MSCWHCLTRRYTTFGFAALQQRTQNVLALMQPVAKLCTLPRVPNLWDGLRQASVQIANLSVDWKQKNYINELKCNSKINIQTRIAEMF